MSTSTPGASLKEDLWNLIVRLFGVYRSLTGSGYRRSLAIIGEAVPLEVLTFPSGARCGSWVVPKEWEVREAYIADVKGTRLVDFESNRFHLCQYSGPFRGVVSSEELWKHIHVHPVLRDAVPLDVAFYRDYWGFCLSQEQLASFQEREYEIVVDTEFRDGSLNVGRLFLAGQCEQVILLDAVLSCPSLANNLSGVAVAVMLARLLSEQKARRWSYRLLLTPETIGPIALRHLAPQELADVVGGYTFVNLGDRSNAYHYRQSRPGPTLADKAMAHALRHSGCRYNLEEFDVRTGSCGNEKAYNSLGIELPIGSLRRQHLGAYPEYDTSKDDLDFIDPDAVFESFCVAWEAIEALERTRVLKHTFVGEPFLTGYGLYPKIANERDRLPWDYLMGFATGTLTTVDIAERAGLPVTAFDDAIRAMTAHGLLVEIR